MRDLQFFDRGDPFRVSRRSLPHWAQAGTLCFLTWRTNDSLPAAAWQGILHERNEALRRFGVDPEAANSRRELATWATLSESCRKQIANLPAKERAKLHWLLFAAADSASDRDLGACVLRRPELARIVGDALLAFDGDRYVVTDFVVMPNHVHVLAAFADENCLVTQPAAWKRFTARKINETLGRTGRFWQVEQFDHLVRCEAEFVQIRDYIAENPIKARLPAGTYLHYSQPL